MRPPLLFWALSALLWAAGQRPAQADAAAVKSDGVGTAGDWVTFRAPAFTGDRLPHGGPDWSFETPRLPAISADARSVLVADSEIQMGGPPNLILRVLRVSDRAVLATLPVLSVDEFDKAAAPHVDEVAARAFADLAKRVEARLAAAAPSLTEVKWRPLAGCTVSPGAGERQPPCSAGEQRLTCGNARFRLTREGLHARWHGHDFDLRTKLFSPAPVRQEGLGRIAVRACFDEVWFDPSSGVLVGLLLNECQSGGDWCIVQPVWVLERVH